MTDFPSTPEQLEALRRDDPAAFARLLRQHEVVKGAWAFLTPAVEDGDLKSVWHLVDVLVRAELAWQWTEDNRESLVNDGHDLQSVAIAIADLPAGEHPLWEHFERVHVRGLRNVLPDPEHWGIGTEFRPLAEDLALVNVMDKRNLADGETWQPGEAQAVYPLALRRSHDGTWMIAQLGQSSLTAQGQLAQ